MLKKIISGGQTGADVGGLIAAKLHGIETGGWMPQGYRTLVGPRPQYAKLFNIKEHSEYGYKPRTWKNIEDSDGTIRIAANFDSAGEKCTLNGIMHHGRPHFDVDIDPKIEKIYRDQVEECFEWIVNNNISILNIAGNSASTWVNARPYTTAFLSYVFMELGFDRLLILPKEYNFIL